MPLRRLFKVNEHLLLCFTEIPVFNVNSVDPDQTPRSAATDFGLHGLPVTFWGPQTKMTYDIKTSEFFKSKYDASIR